MKLTTILFFALLSTSLHAQFDQFGAVVGSYIGPDEVGGSCALVGDIDDDGVEDFVLGTEGPTSSFPGLPYVTVVSGADGAVLVTVTLDCDQILEIAPITDFDLDGIPEIAVLGFHLGGVAIFAVASSTGGKVWQHIYPNSFLPSPVLKEAGDFDNDGVSDVACGFGNNVLLLSGATGLGLGEKQGIGQLDPTVHAKPALVAHMDLDGDGVAEIVFSRVRAASQPQLESLLVLAPGSPTLTAKGLVAPPPGATSFGSNLAILDDLNGDGRREVLVSARPPGTTSPSGQVTLYVCDWFQGVVLQTIQLAGTSGLRSLSDANGDGVSDFAVASFLANTPQVVTGFRVYSGADYSQIATIPGPTPDSFPRGARSIERAGSNASDILVFGPAVLPLFPPPPVSAQGGFAFRLRLAGDLPYGTGNYGLTATREPSSLDFTRGPIVVDGAEAQSTGLAVVSLAESSQILPGTQLEVLVDLNQVVIWDDSLSFDVSGRGEIFANLSSAELAGMVVYFQAASFGPSGARVSNGLKLIFTH